MVGLSIGLLYVASVWSIASFTSLAYCCSLLLTEAPVKCVLLLLADGSSTSAGKHTLNARLVLLSCIW